MKKIIIPFILVIALVFQSCEETQSPIYDGSQTLAYFATSNIQLSVPSLESSASISVPVNVSTLSSTERTITVSIVEAGTTATSDMYSLNTSVVVPANTYFATLDITGFQQGLSETGDLLILSIDGVDGGVGSPTTLSVNIIKTCPFDITNFYGTYSSMQVYNGTAADLAAGPDVTASAGPEENLVLLENLYGVGRFAMIEIDNSDPDAPVVLHRSLEFGAIFNAGTTVGDLFTTELFASGGSNTFNTCTSGISLNFLRTNGTSVFNWPYIMELTKQ